MDTAHARATAHRITTSMTFAGHTPWARHPFSDNGWHWSDEVLASLAVAVGDSEIVYASGYLTQHATILRGYQGEVVVFTMDTIVRAEITAAPPMPHSGVLDGKAIVRVFPITALDSIEIGEVSPIPAENQDSIEPDDWPRHVTARAHVGELAIDLPLSGGLPLRHDPELLTFILGAFRDQL